ncbi:MAG TPA: carbohydrate ABC transporter permease [Armatimonadota bacterium]|nr:carbohydrate ABC transporter permease [Armatimonadota bacterium]
MVNGRLRKTTDPRVRFWRNLKTALTYLVLIGLSCVFLIPFFWMLSTSLTEASKVIVRDREWIPHPFMWSNYYKALTVLPFQLFLKNTLIITICCIIGQTLSASLVAFGFSRMRFPGRNVLFIMVLSTMMLPVQVTQIPTFVIFTHLRWIDTLKPLIVPAFFGGGAFFIFLLRQFFMTIPSELEDAAKIDGCSSLGIYWNVALPLSKPALATVAIFSFMGHWNDFMGPLIYIQSMENKTLALGLNSFRSLHGTEYHLLMAASISVLLPVLIIFFCAQKYFVQGIVLSGIKG